MVDVECPECGGEIELDDPEAAVGDETPVSCTDCGFASVAVKRGIDDASP